MYKNDHMWSLQATKPTDTMTPLVRNPGAKRSRTFNGSKQGNTEEWQSKRGKETAKAQIFNQEATAQGQTTHAVAEKPDFYVIKWNGEQRALRPLAGRDVDDFFHWLIKQSSVGFTPLQKYFGQ